MKNTVTKQKERILSNPPERREIRKDFPEMIINLNAKKLLKVLDQELRKQGTSLEQVGHITLAYPHKHPIFHPKHYNSAESAAIKLKKQLKSLAPQVQWIIADEICETVDLRRSKDQRSIHALRDRQIYDIHKSSQKEILPFISPSHQEKEFFVTIDSIIEQGTTLANLRSYIEHNGGFVLAAVSEYFALERAVAQKDVFTKRNHLSKKFNNAARNTGRLSEMADVFSKSAKESGLDWSPELCMNMFNESLKKHGNNVFALTNEECSQLIKTVNGRFHEPESFPSILENLDSKFVTTTAKQVNKPPPKTKKSIMQRLSTLVLRNPAPN